MFAESPTPILKTGLVVAVIVMTWVLGGFWVSRQSHPVTAEAVLQLPPATDLELLCSEPDLVDQVRTRFEENRSIAGEKNSAGLASPHSSSNWGTLTVSKSASGDWILHTDASDRQDAMAELTAWIDVLTARIAQPDQGKQADQRGRLSRQLQQLTEQLSELERSLDSDAKIALDRDSNDQVTPESNQPTIEEFDFPNEKSRNKHVFASQRHGDIAPASFESKQSDQSSESEDEFTTSVNASDTVALSEQVKSLEREAKAARAARVQIEKEIQIVRSRFEVEAPLESISKRLTPGPIQKILRQIERQARLSGELQQLNATLVSDAEIYGEKHPRLVEHRRRFDQLLDEVGGWENLLAEKSIADTLYEQMEHALAQQVEIEEDLQLHLELEQSELRHQHERDQLQSDVIADRQHLQSRIEATRAQLAALPPSAESGLKIQTPPKISGGSLLWRAATSWGFVGLVGLLAGFLAHRTIRIERSVEYPIFGETTLLTIPQLPNMPSEVPDLFSQLNQAPSTVPTLAERRSNRQTRWQQTYS